MKSRVGLDMVEEKLITLTSIIIEHRFRNGNENPSLALSLKSNGQSTALVVEGPTVPDNKYFLVEGELRYESLLSINAKKARCIVQKLTSEEERVIKNLRNELQTKKKTSYEISRMVEFLLSKGYIDKQIAIKCSVSSKTINKYLKAQNIRSDWKERAEETGAGLHALADIEKLNNLTANVQEDVADDFINRKINGTEVESLLKINSVDELKDLTELHQKECVLEAVNQTTFENSQAKTIVYEKLLRQSFSERAHYSVYQLIVTLLEKITRNLHHNFTDNLDVNQKQKLHENIIKMASLTKLPHSWFIPDVTIIQTQKKTEIIKLNFNSRSKKVNKNNNNIK